MLEKPSPKGYHVQAVRYRLDELMNATAHQILTLGEDLIRTRGYSAFSFQDIADEIGIRKASIHYHFASKAELGLAVIKAYRARMTETAERALATEDARQALALYVEPIVELGRVARDICTAGILGTEHLALPETIQVEVAAFFREQIAWLAEILDRGRQSGDFSFAGTAENTATLFLSAVEGGLMMKRVLDEPQRFAAVLETALAMIIARSAA